MTNNYILGNWKSRFSITKWNESVWGFDRGTHFWFLNIWKYQVKIKKGLLR